MATFFLSAALPRIVNMAVRTCSAVKTSCTPPVAMAKAGFQGQEKEFSGATVFVAALRAGCRDVGCTPPCGGGRGDWFFKKSCDEAKGRVTRPGTALSQLILISLKDSWVVRACERGGASFFVGERGIENLWRRRAGPGTKQWKIIKSPRKTSGYPQNAPLTLRKTLCFSLP